MKAPEREKRKYGWFRMAAAALFLGLAFAGNALAAESGWALEHDGWHYYLSDGSGQTGWLELEGKHYYLADNGVCLTDAMTPDGYYVDGDGAWYQRQKTILGVGMTAPEQFCPAEVPFREGGALGAFSGLIRRSFGGTRLLRVSDKAVEYVSTGRTDGQRASGEETVLAGLYRDAENGRYRLDLRMGLDGEAVGRESAAAYDYGVFQALLYQISSSPEVLEAAVCSAWSGENQWNINRQSPVMAGDSQVLYAAGDGFGRFYITPRPAQ